MSEFRTNWNRLGSILNIDSNVYSTIGKVADSVLGVGSLYVNRIPVHQRSLISQALTAVEDLKGKGIKGVAGDLWSEAKNFLSGVTHDHLLSAVDRALNPHGAPMSMESEKFYSDPLLAPLGGKDKVTSVLGSIVDRVSPRMTTMGPRNYAYDSFKFNSKKALADYNSYNDPYEGRARTLSKSGDFREIVQELRGLGLLTNHKKLTGFEIGSNGDWFIQIYPYPYEKDDVSFYKSIGRNCLTPSLPSYLIPFSAPYSNTGNPNNKIVDDVTRNLLKDYIQPINGDKLLLDNYVAVTKDIFQNSTLFSFSRDLPCLSYDLNIGGLKNESIPLFAGSAIQVPTGMSYNATLNVSILDDVYGSMYNYMIEYINTIYDNRNGSIAPYFAAAFQINLIIMMPGSQIKYKYKFIGVPIEFNARLDGASDGNEARVDVTFGIVGFKKYNNRNSSTSSKMRNENSRSLRGVGSRNGEQYVGNPNGVGYMGNLLDRWEEMQFDNSTLIIT